MLCGDAMVLQCTNTVQTETSLV